MNGMTIATLLMVAMNTKEQRMQLHTLEEKAMKDKKNEHTYHYGNLVVIWDDIFEYYHKGSPVLLDREDALELLNDIEYDAAKNNTRPIEY